VKNQVAGLKACATLLVALSACRTVSHRPAPPGLPAPPALVAQIDSILAAPELERGYWGVLVKSLTTDETLYARNARKLFVPASNMKIVTLAAAAQTLGWNYTYTTKLVTVGTVENGTLAGDLAIVGSGDPSLVAADGMSDRVFADWASRVKSAGIRTIAGHIVAVDDRAADEDALGAGWMWDDLVEDYAAGVGALQLNEDAVRVTIAPGPAPGSSAAVSVAPFPGTLTIDSTVITSGTEPTIRIRRLPGSSRLELRGSIPFGHAPLSYGVAVDDPLQFFADQLRTALIRNGVDVRGSAITAPGPKGPGLREDERRADPFGPALVEYRSAPLSTLAIRLMKISQNQYAETFYRTIGGRDAVMKIVQPWGVTPADLIQRDGSGLSRYDLVTPEALVTILTHVARDETLRGPFAASLPVAGSLGLTNRMKGTPAEGNATAKTGSMTGVRSLSGYVTSGDGEPLVFSIIANNFDAEPATINRATDAIIVRLAQFRR